MAFVLVLDQLDEDSVQDARALLLRHPLQLLVVEPGIEFAVGADRLRSDLVRFRPNQYSKGHLGMVQLSTTLALVSRTAQTVQQMRTLGNNRQIRRIKLT